VPCHDSGNLARRVEAVDVSPSPGQEAIDAIGDRAGVGNRDEQGAVVPQHSPDLAQGGRKVLEVLQAVVRDDGLERTAPERQPDCVALNGIRPGGRRQALDVQPEGLDPVLPGMEASAAGAEVKDPCCWPKVPEDLLHGVGFLSRPRRLGL
jgi:hypothetical protein